MLSKRLDVTDELGGRVLDEGACGCGGMGWYGMIEMYGYACVCVCMCTCTLTHELGGRVLDEGACVAGVMIWT